MHLLVEGGGLTTRLAGACLQNFSGHQVLDDLAQQLNNLAITQRRQRHTRPRQQKVARQDRDLYMVSQNLHQTQREGTKTCHSFIQTRVQIQDQTSLPQSVDMSWWKCQSLLVVKAKETIA